MSALTEITFTNKDDSREIIDEVVQQAFESVCSTMGPNGRYVVINQTNRPNVTKDGVSVAKALDFNESRKNLIAKIITEPSIKTDIEVGDGTTTTVFQTYHLYKKFGNKLTFKNTRYLDGLMVKVKEHLETLITQSDIHSPEFRSMLLTSANYEETIVEKMLEIYHQYDAPNIYLQKAPMLPADELELVKEIQFQGEFANDAFTQRMPINGMQIGANKAHVVLADASVATLTDETLSTITNVAIDTPVFLVARNFEQNAIHRIMQLNNNLQRPAIIPIKLQASGSLGTAIFNDLATLLNTGTTHDLRQLKAEEVKYIDVPLTFKTNGIFISKEISTVAGRANLLLTPMDQRYTQMSIVERQTVIGRELFKRIGRLRANNVVIRVTGVTESDTRERYYRYEDVMKAAKTGLQYGVIPGIGYGYMEASKFVLSLPQQSDGELESLRTELAELLTYQYSHLTGIQRDDEEFGKFIDLVTGEVSDKPTTVYDNAAATMIALEGAWATAKTLGKLNNIMGRSNQSYS